MLSAYYVPRIVVASVVVSQYSCEQARSPAFWGFPIEQLYSQESNDYGDNYVITMEIHAYM